jgi:hypothetical protein
MSFTVAIFQLYSLERKKTKVAEKVKNGPFEAGCIWFQQFSEKCFIKSCWTRSEQVKIYHLERRWMVLAIFH